MFVTFMSGEEIVSAPSTIQSELLVVGHCGLSINVSVANFASMLDFVYERQARTERVR